MRILICQGVTLATAAGVCIAGFAVAFRKMAAILTSFEIPEIPELPVEDETGGDVDAQAAPVR